MKQYLNKLKHNFDVWLEMNVGALRKPTYYRQMTTYYSYIQWVGKLTGTHYHMVNFKLTIGESPEVITKRNKE